MTTTEASVATRPRATTPAGPFRVAVAAVDEELGAQLVAILSSAGGLSVHTLRSATALFRHGDRYEAVVIHCNAGDADEIALISRLRRALADARIVVVCSDEHQRGSRRVADAGVDGIVFRSRVASALAPTVAAVLAGQAALPRELRVSLQRPVLSAREKQILGMVVMGFTNGQICARLFLAESTVKSHLSSAFSKLGVRSRHEATALILDPHGSLGTGILAITSPRAAAG